MMDRCRCRTANLVKRAQRCVIASRGARIRMEREVKRAGFPRAIGTSWLVPWLILAAAAGCLGQEASSRASQRQSALTFENEGNVAEAEAAWRSLLRAQPNDSEAYAHLGLLEARQQHYKEAIDLDRKALRLNPAMPHLRLNLGLALFKAGDLRGAIQTFEALLKHEPKSSPEALRLVTLIGLAHYALGDYAAAIPYLKQADDGDPQNLEFRMDLAQSCLKTKQYQCVLDTYHQILTINPNSAEADMLMGEAYDEMKDEGKAMEQYEAAIKADPTIPNAHFGYGYMLWRLLQFSQAEQEFNAELAINPDHAFALAYLGDTELQLNHPDQAKLNLARAIQLEPSIALAHLDLGILYQNQGRKEEALRELKAAEKLEPNDQQVHWDLGRLYKSMGQEAEAKVEFEKTRKVLDSRIRSTQEKLQRLTEASKAGAEASQGTGQSRKIPPK